MERHILREGSSFCPISSSRSQGVPMLAPLASYRQRHPKYLWSDAFPWLGYRFSGLSKSDCMVLTSPGLLPVCTPARPACPDALPFPCLLITTWQFVKVHGVTRNKPKIHVICYITIGDSSLDRLSSTLMRWGILPLCRGVVGVFYSPIRLGNLILVRQYKRFYTYKTSRQREQVRILISSSKLMRAWTLNSDNVAIHLKLKLQVKSMKFLYKHKRALKTDGLNELVTN